MREIVLKRKKQSQLDFIDSLSVNYATNLLYEYGKYEDNPKLSIGILGYRNIDKTKRCVESVLKYAKGIDYELILMDNGSNDDDETVNYYRTVDYEKTIIIKIENPIGVNYGSVYGTQLMFEYSSGDYFIFLGNDNIITENALQNMIVCLDSDVDIGIVTPMSSNVWMGQDPRLKYNNYDEMFEVSKKFNISDPRKWKERTTLSVVATMFKKEAAQRVGFYNALAEYDFCYRFRQAGYKTMLLGDTWVCHDHNYTGKNAKDDSQPWIGETDKARYILEMQEKIRLEYFDNNGTFEDVITFKDDLINLYEVDNKQNKPRILSIDVECGQGLLDIKNKLRTVGIFNTDATAYTTNVKHYNWLKMITDEVYCDRIQFLPEVLEGKKYDYIIVGVPINFYNDTDKVLSEILNLLDKDGQCVFYVRNTLDINSLLKILGLQSSVDANMPAHITIEDVYNIIKNKGYDNIKVSRGYSNYSNEIITKVDGLLGRMTKDVFDHDKIMQDLFTMNYCVWVKK